MRKETAKKIADSIDKGTNLSVIANLLELEQITVDSVGKYIDYLKKKDNEACIDARNTRYFIDDVFNYLEDRYNFHPDMKQESKEDINFRNDMLNRVGWLGDLVEDMSKMVSKQTKMLEEMKAANVDLGQKIMLIVNANLNNRK